MEENQLRNATRYIQYDLEFTPKHLRDHYNNKLRPNLNTSDFSIDEDITICKIVLEYGKDWKRIL